MRRHIRASYKVRFVTHQCEYTHFLLTPNCSCTSLVPISARRESNLRLCLQLFWPGFFPVERLRFARAVCRMIARAVRAPKTTVLRASSAEPAFKGDPMRTPILCCFLQFFLFVLLASTCLFSQSQLSDPQAVALAQQSIAVLTAGVTISDLTLNAHAASTLRSDDETGTATLETKGTGESRVDVNLSGETRSDVRNATGGSPAGACEKNGNSSTAYAFLIVGSMRAGTRRFEPPQRLFEGSLCVSRNSSAGSGHKRCDWHHV
jgi:hypothetical protein